MYLQSIKNTKSIEIMIIGNIIRTCTFYTHEIGNL